MDELRIVEFGDGQWVNLYWMEYSTCRKVFNDDTGEYHYDLTFVFADGRGGQVRVKTDEAGLDMVREAMV